MLAVACRSSSLLHESAMDSTTEAEDLVIDPKLLAQLENLESQCNPDFDLGFDEWLATQNTGVFEEQLNSLSAEENCSSVTDGIQPQPKKPKLSLSLKKKRQPLKQVTNTGRFASPVTKEAYNEAGKGVIPANTKQCNS